MKKMISLLVALGVLIIGVGMPQAGSDRALCKQAIMSFRGTRDAIGRQL